MSAVCIDCDEKIVREYYMVQHELWAEYVGHPDAGQLCIGCLEGRMGRQLVPADFLDCPLSRLDSSYQPRRSARYLARLTGDDGCGCLG